MKDISGKDFRNRAIVAFFSEGRNRICYGVINQIYISVLLVDGFDSDGFAFQEEISEHNVLQVKHDQLPENLKEKLIQLSKFRI